MTVDAEYTLSFVTNYCADIAEDGIEKYGLLPGKDYQETLIELTMGCTSSVLEKMTNITE